MALITVGFGYRKRRGKDTLANLVQDYLREQVPNLNVRKVGFADKLKDMSYQLFSWSGLQPGIYYENKPEFKEQVLPKLGLTPRDVWIAVGNLMRTVHKDVWVNAVVDTPAAVLLIKDMGFLNEFNVCDLTVRVDRDGPMASDDRETQLDAVPLDRWNFVVGNNGSLKDLVVDAQVIGDCILSKLEVRRAA